MRNRFAAEISRLSHDNPKIMLLSGDIGNNLFNTFKEQHGERFLNCGIAEANMMGMAAGLALSGFRPIVYTITPFTTTRCFEQIRVDVCYHHVPVIIVGTGSGLAYAELGPTHHSCEDIAILRALPGMTVFCPADSTELALGLEAALKLDTPVYVRLGKKGEPDLYQNKPDFALGKAITLKEGQDICLISTGTITAVALDAAKKLDEMGISARVESFHTVKPLDKTRLREIFDHYPIVATVEEHNQIGGLYSSVCEWGFEENRTQTRIISFATKDEFLHEVGTQDHARQKYGLTIENISTVLYKQCLDLLNKKTALSLSLRPLGGEAITSREASSVDVDG